MSIRERALEASSVSREDNRSGAVGGGGGGGRGLSRAQGQMEGGIGQAPWPSADQGHPLAPRDAHSVIQKQNKNPTLESRAQSMPKLPPLRRAKRPARLHAPVVCRLAGVTPNYQLDLAATNYQNHGETRGYTWFNTSPRQLLKW